MDIMRLVQRLTVMTMIIIRRIHRITKTKYKKGMMRIVRLLIIKTNMKMMMMTISRNISTKKNSQSTKQFVTTLSTP